MVFFDPNCPFCVKLWHDLQKWHDNLIVKWIPVAFVHPSSLGMAARVFSAKDPQKVLAFNEEHYDLKTDAAHAYRVDRADPIWHRKPG